MTTGSTRNYSEPNNSDDGMGALCPLDAEKAWDSMNSKEVVVTRIGDEKNLRRQKEYSSKKLCQQNENSEMKENRGPRKTPD